MELHQTFCTGGIVGLTGTTFICGTCRGFSPRGGGGGPPQAKLLARLCSVVEVSEGKTDAHECGRQCQIFKTKNKSFENWKSEAICILPCLKSGIVGDFI